MKHRLEELRQARVKKLPEYNRISDQKLCRIAIFCDEIGEMLDKKGKSKEEKVLYEELESYISSISRMGRAPGINLFLGVQRPDANIITGQIKANVPVRICGRFTDKVSSEIVLGSSAATCLPAIKGRFVFSLGNAPISMQSYFCLLYTSNHIPAEQYEYGGQIYELVSYEILDASLSERTELVNDVVDYKGVEQIDKIPESCEIEVKNKRCV